MLRRDCTKSQTFPWWQGIEPCGHVCLCLECEEMVTGKTVRPHSQQHTRPCCMSAPRLPSLPVSITCGSGHASTGRDLGTLCTCIVLYHWQHVQFPTAGAPQQASLLRTIARPLASPPPSAAILIVSLALQRTWQRFSKQLMR